MVAMVIPFTLRSMSDFVIDGQYGRGDFRLLDHAAFYLHEFVSARICAWAEACEFHIALIFLVAIMHIIRYYDRIARMFG